MNRYSYARLRNISITQPPSTQALSTCQTISSQKLRTCPTLHLRRAAAYWSLVNHSGLRTKRNSTQGTFALSRSFTTTFAHHIKPTVMNGTNGAHAVGHKRHHAGDSNPGPQKKPRGSVNGKMSAGENTPEVIALPEEEDDMEFIDERPAVIPGLADTAEWQAAIEKVVRNVVSIRFCQTCSFDTDPALTSEATGFVVDAERGCVSSQRLEDCVS